MLFFSLLGFIGNFFVSEEVWVVAICWASSRLVLPRCCFSQCCWSWFWLLLGHWSGSSVNFHWDFCLFDAIFLVSGFAVVTSGLSFVWRGCWVESKVPRFFLQLFIFSAFLASTCVDFKWWVFVSPFRILIIFYCCCNIQIIWQDCQVPVQFISLKIILIHWQTDEHCFGAVFLRYFWSILFILSSPTLFAVETASDYLHLFFKELRQSGPSHFVSPSLFLVSTVFATIFNSMERLFCFSSSQLFFFLWLAYWSLSQILLGSEKEALQSIFRFSWWRSQVFLWILLFGIHFSGQKLVQGFTLLFLFHIWDSCLPYLQKKVVNYLIFVRNSCE